MPTHCANLTAGARVAHCIVGAAAHANRIDRFPIYDSRNYQLVQAWLEQLRSYGGTHDVFLSLDNRIWPKRSELEAQGRVAAGSQSVQRVGDAQLADMLAALKPAAFEAYEAPPICAAHKCLCTSLSYPSWWEQMAKNAACMRLVERREKAMGVRYDFVTKLRSDYFTAASARLAEGSAEVVAHPIHAMTRGNERAVYIKGWAAGTCYGQADWFALMPRDLAGAYFSMVPNATCAWAEETARAVRARDSHVRGLCPTLNERALVEWVVHNRGAIRNTHDALQVRHACALRTRCGKEGRPWCYNR